MKINAIKGTFIAAARRAVGDEAIDDLLLKRNFVEYRKRGIIFIHVPKCAGSSVSRALYGRSLGHHSAAKLRHHGPQDFATLPSFAVLRDPVARAYSAWQYIRSGGTQDGWAKDRPEYHTPTFRSFESFAQEWLPAQSPGTLDYVFQPQSTFVCQSDGRVIVDQLFPLHQLNERWPRLTAKLPVVDTLLGRRNVNNRSAGAEQAVSAGAGDAIRSYYSRDVLLYSQADSGSNR